MTIYKLFSNCIPVKGYSRSIILDLQRQSYFLIPNTLIDLFEDDLLVINEKNEYSDTEKNIINEYISFLLENDLVFMTNKNELELFPKLNLDWNYPSTITNAVFDIKDNDLDWHNILTGLKELQCYHIQIRYFSPVSIEKIKEICNIMFSSLVFSIDIILPYNLIYKNKEWIELMENYPKISKIIFYNSNSDEVVHIDNKGFSAIYCIRTNCNSDLHCGIIHPGYFSINIPTFTESQMYNTCLNRKIGIDVDGNIKNCPSCNQTFGNINEISLLEAIQKQGFKQYWNITKDQIDVCKDCEFRHICIDCRAFIKDPENKYSQPLKCNFNPYISKWSNEHGYVPIEECGTYSKEDGFIPEKNKISTLNNIIWPD